MKLVFIYILSNHNLLRVLCLMQAYVLKILFKNSDGIKSSIILISYSTYYWYSFNRHACIHVEYNKFLKVYSSISFSNQKNKNNWYSHKETSFGCELMHRNKTSTESVELLLISYDCKLVKKEF